MPKVLEELSTSQVLIMERIEGVPLHEFHKNQSTEANLAKLAAPVVLKALARRWIRWPSAKKPQ